MTAYTYRPRRRPSCPCGHVRPKRRRESLTRVRLLNEASVVGAVASNA